MVHTTTAFVRMDLNVKVTGPLEDPLSTPTLESAQIPIMPKLPTTNDLYITLNGINRQTVH